MSAAAGQSSIRSEDDVKKEHSAFEAGRATSDPSLLRSMSKRVIPNAVIERPNIKDYAVIGDCRTAALISREGSLDWLCLPDFSSPSVFARLLDQNGGHFSIRPTSAFTTTRRYLPASAVLETTFEIEGGRARLTDLCPIIDGTTSLQPMRETLRILECIEGTIELDIEVAPRPNYGYAKPTLHRIAENVWGFEWPGGLLLLNSTTDLFQHGAVLRRAVRLAAGRREDFSLCYIEHDVGIIAPLGPEAESRCKNTVAWWQDWSRACQFDGPERDAVLRSAITLKLLTFCLSGAIVAAPTTSIPESLGAERNWDYRYCWLRDAGLTMSALVGLGFHREASAYLTWLLHATRLSRPNLSILYDVYGRTNLRERKLDWFAGYHNSSPVRVGNDAVAQFQLDPHGQVIAAAQVFAGAGCELDPTEAQMLAGFGEIVCRRWREPDNGIWEIPGQRRQYTFSKVMCWVALDKLLWLQDKRIVDIGQYEALFRHTRQEIADCIETEGYDPNLDTYTGELKGKDVDAALLLMPCFGYREPSHPRMISTYDRIRKELGRDGLLYRYRSGYDGLQGREGASGLCSFFAVSHLAARGLIKEAERSFDHLCSFANDVGLFAEEIQPRSGEPLGNFPQAFTHVGLIYSALSIQRARSGAGQWIL
jgi:GH15 family glucan-1,4-alpha-glucosidase